MPPEKEKSQSYTSCPVCQAAFSGYVIDELDIFTFESCRTCGSVLTNPMPTQDMLIELLEKEDIKVTHIHPPEREIAYYERTIRKIMRDYTDKRFLDVTCQHGYTVRAALDLGFQKAHGITVFKSFYNFAREHYGQDRFTHAKLSDYSADSSHQAELIFSAEGICMQSDPDSYIKSIVPLMAPDGKLYIQEPNGNSVWVPKKFTKWAFVNPPFNFIYPSFKGMQKLLKRHGLKIERKLFTWGPFMRLIVTK